MRMKLALLKYFLHENTCSSQGTTMFLTGRLTLVKYGDNDISVNVCLTSSPGYREISE